MRGPAAVGQRRRRTPLREDESGQALIEFAVSFSVLLTFVFTLMEICLAFYTYGVISEVAREGTRYAVLRGSTCQNSSGTSCTATAASINAYVAGIRYPNLGGGTLIVNTTFPDGNQAPGSRVRIAVSYVFRIQLPIVPRNSLTLTNSSQMYILQ